MKKILILIIVSAFITIPATAQVNMPGEPTYGTSSTTKTTTSPSSYYKKTTTSNTQNNYPKVNIPQTTSSSSTGSKATLDSMAMAALKAAENHNDQKMNDIIQKMIKAGAEGFSTPQIISKRTPHCPPIRIEVNGKKMSGSKCAMFGYLYKGKQYDIGYCK